MNKTALSRDTNIRIGGQSPASYLRRIETAAGMSSGHLDSILHTHAINPDHLRTASFNEFFEDRVEGYSV